MEYAWVGMCSDGGGGMGVWGRGNARVTVGGCEGDRGVTGQRSTAEGGEVHAWKVEPKEGMGREFPEDAEGVDKGWGGA